MKTLRASRFADDARESPMPDTSAEPKDPSEPTRRVDLDRACWYVYEPGWLPPGEADAQLAALLADSEWVQRPIVARGREVMQPRLMDWYGETPYRYSNLVLDPRPMPPRIVDLNDRASRFAGESFDHVLLNLYRNGRDSIGMHADNEPELGWEPVIGSLSLGAPRKFVIQHKQKRSWRRTIVLEHGSMLVMGGAFQRRWRHGVPATTLVDAPRINVTFRRLFGPPGWRPEPRPLDERER